MAPFPTVCSPLSYKNQQFIQKLEFSHGQDGRGLKTTFSIMDSVDSWVTVSEDLVDHSGSAIVNRSITIFSHICRHFTGLTGKW